MQFVGIDLHTNRFTCSYRDGTPSDGKVAGGRTTETFNMEALDGGRSQTPVRQAVFIYIEAYYNRVRMHSALDFTAPDMFYLEKAT